jgi:protein-L-isoaspartate(D-aspartate) O-methyltransferase
MRNERGIQGIGMTSARTRDRLVQRLREQGIRSNAVLEQIRNVPRHLFVDEALASRAYEDTALPIGLGQTISQPYIVARMTEALLDGFSGKRVLEIGTGCGYQTAVLAPLVREIYSVERIPELMKKTRQRLRDLNIYNVHLRQGTVGKAGANTPRTMASSLLQPPAKFLRACSSSLRRAGG